MARAWSLSNPHPDHVLTVNRVPTGRTATGGMRYGTVVRCSCGAPWGWQRVSNTPPSRSRRQVAAHYTFHVQQALAETEPPPAFGEPPCLA